MTAMMETMDLRALKNRQQAMWATGDFSMIGSMMILVGENLCEAVDLHPGQQVLDVATGSGNTALAAARRHCEVTGVDYVPALLERGRERAAAEGLSVRFMEGDAEYLPFPDASFDVVLSTFGAMFAPAQEIAAREMLRVCRPGGKIGMANWTPEGFAGQMFRIVGRYIPPAPGIRPPGVWGTEMGLRELFGDQIISMEMNRRNFMFRYPSPQHWLDIFRRYFGPIRTAYEALDENQQDMLTRDLMDLMERSNRDGAGSLIVPGEYMEVVAMRR